MPPQWGPPPWGPSQWGPPQGGAPPQWGQTPRPWAQQPPWPGSRPPRRSRAGLIAALAAVLVAAIAVTTVLVVNRDDNPTATPAVAPVAPAVSTSEERTTEARVTERTTKERATAPAPTPDPTSAPRTTSAPRSTTPRRSTSTPTSKPKPSPTSQAPGGAQKVLAPADNPLLQDPNAGLQNRACSLPVWQTSSAAAERFFTAEAACLNAAWKPLLQDYDMPFTPPELHFPQGSSFDTPCGVMNVGIALAAYYCEGHLYVPYRGLQTDRYGDDPGVYTAVFAHEYGHHVQEKSGLMDAAWKKIRAYGETSARGQDMSRRKELQAQCFSGMFLGAHVERGGTITREMYDSAWVDQDTRGDGTSGAHDHGTNAHFAQWWRTGATSNRIAQCNTFAASSGDVS